MFEEVVNAVAIKKIKEMLQIERVILIFVVLVLSPNCHEYCDIVGYLIR